MTPRLFVIGLLLTGLANTAFTQESSPSSIILPIELAGKLILVEAYVNGKKGNFIIDTGAESLILNSRYFYGIKNSEEAASNFAGQASAISHKMVRLGWPGQSEKKYLATIVNLQLLESKLRVDIMGYIGYEVLKDYELVFDLPHLEVIFYKLDKKGKRYSLALAHTEPSDTIMMKANGRQPFLIARFGTKNLKLGIDSGAALNLLRPGIAKKLGKHFINAGPRQVVGYDGQPATMPSGILHDLKLSQLSWPGLRTLITPLDQINKGLSIPLDGILGFEFLNSYKVAINYRKSEMYLWDPKKIRPEPLSLTREDQKNK